MSITQLLEDHQPRRRRSIAALLLHARCYRVINIHPLSLSYLSLIVTQNERDEERRRWRRSCRGGREEDRDLLGGELSAEGRQPANHIYRPKFRPTRSIHRSASTRCFWGADSFPAPWLMIDRVTFRELADTVCEENNKWMAFEVKVLCWPKLNILHLKGILLPRLFIN